MSLLKDFKETKYLSKNKLLLGLISSIDDLFIRNSTSLQCYIYVKNNLWREYDNYLRNMDARVVNFFKKGNNDIMIKIFCINLKLLFCYRYFLPIGEKISETQFQTALGIQQVIWMINPGNKDSKKGSIHKHLVNKKQVEVELTMTTDKAIFFYWKNIDKNNQLQIIEQLSFQLKDKMYTKFNIKSQIQSCIMDNSVWYLVRNMSKGWTGYGVTSNLRKLDGTYPIPFLPSGFPQFFPIPETLTFNKIACVYKPTLVFGTMKSSSLSKFMIRYKKRPFHAHFPDSKNNLVIIHVLALNIVKNWIHDFSHMTVGHMRSPQKGIIADEDELKTQNNHCKYKDLTIRRINNECQNNDKLVDFIDHYSQGPLTEDDPYGLKYHSKYINTEPDSSCSENFFDYLNDFSYLYLTEEQMKSI